MSPPRVLFISYNGLIEPLGRTQIVPYLQVLGVTYDVSVLSFEKRVRSVADDAQDARDVAALLRERRVRWIQRRYHKRPSLPATLFDIIAGVAAAIQLHRRRPLALVHARGYVPGAIAWALKWWCGIPYLFDIRGLQAEEYVDAGHWSPRGVKFRLTKRIEQRMLRDADGLVTLTEAIRQTVLALPGLAGRENLPPWEVIPCCADLGHFRFRQKARAGLRARLGFEERVVLVYAGSIGTWYMLDEMVAFYAAARRTMPGLFFLLLVNGSHQLVRAALAQHGVAEGQDALIRQARFEEMPDYLSAADAGLAFIRPCFSKRSSSPTKYAEYLACGLPLVINAGIGDANILVERYGAGVLLRSFTSEAYAEAATALREQLVRSRDAFRALAEAHFSLTDRAVPAYRGLYERILGRSVHPPSPEAPPLGSPLRSRSFATAQQGVEEGEARMASERFRPTGVQQGATGLPVGLHASRSREVDAAVATVQTM